MRTSSAVKFAFRLNRQIISELNGTPAVKPSVRKDVNKSAAFLACVGIGLSSFSLKQLASKSPARKF
ncbi:unnamed protein product [Diamesa serratosioi]